MQSAAVNEVVSSCEEKRQYNVQCVIEESAETFAYALVFSSIITNAPTVGLKISPFKNNNINTLYYSNIGNQLIDSVNCGFIGALITGIKTGFSRIQITSSPPIYERPKIGPGASMYG